MELNRSERKKNEMECFKLDTDFGREQARQQKQTK